MLWSRRVGSDWVLHHGETLWALRVFLKPSKGMSSSYVIFFSFTLLKYIYIYIMVFQYFLNNNFRTWTTKLSLAVFYKIKKFAIIEIIISNVTHLSFIFLYCLVIYILFCFNKSFRSFNVWIFELFFCSIWNCLTNFL